MTKEYYYRTSLGKYQGKCRLLSPKIGPNYNIIRSQIIQTDSVIICLQNFKLVHLSFDQDCRIWRIIVDRNLPQCLRVDSRMIEIG